MTRRKDTARRRKRSRSKGGHSERSLHDAETLRLCRLAVENQDVHALRQLACSRGLVNKDMRQLCWPLLLGVGPEAGVRPEIDAVAPPACPEGDERPDHAADGEGPAPSQPGGIEAELNGGAGAYSSWEQYERWHGSEHRDSHVVVVDVERSLWTFTPGMGDEQREVLRQQLKRLLNAAVGQYAGSAPGHQVYYYQGLHDIASVLLLELGGEARAFPLLGRLVAGHLRDCTRESLEPVLELLQLLWPLLHHVDRELGQSLRAVGLPPYFALSWYITWFAHDVKSLRTAARLFDLFISSHPLMPLYLGASAMRCMRQPLLACREMHEAHTLLAHLDLCGEGMPPLEELLGAAGRLMERVPPEGLLRSLGRDAAPMRLSVSPWAKLGPGGVWSVPEEPGALAAPAPGNGLQQLLSSVPHWLLRGGGPQQGEAGAGAGAGRKRGRQSRPLMVLSLGGMLSVYVVAVVLSYTVMRGPGGTQGSL